MFKIDLFGPYWGHFWSILRPNFGYVYNIFAARCLKWLKILELAKFCSMELCGDILLPGGQLETPGLVI